LISVLIGMFFVLLGVLLVDATTTATWVAPAHPLSSPRAFAVRAVSRSYLRREGASGATISAT
jgi:membrane-bound metal-dependent hydrolase YbcI (DUF457 family)